MSLIANYDRADILALGEAHDSQRDSDLRIALVRHPDFAKRVRAVVVEFGSTTEQATLDRYIRGEAVTPAELAQVWKTTTQPSIREGGSSRFYVRDVNATRCFRAHVRGDPRRSSASSDADRALEIILNKDGVRADRRHERDTTHFGWFRRAPRRRVPPPWPYHFLPQDRSAWL